MTAVTSALTPPPEGALLFQVVESFVSGFSLFAAAELGIADALADGPRTMEELARATDSHPPSLSRLLQALATTGIVTEVEPGRFALTATGTSLQTGRPESIVPMLELLAKLLLPALQGIAETVRTGQPALARQLGMPLYEYLEQHPELDDTFGRAMSMLRAVSTPVAEAYDFSWVDTLVDVGGGQGWRTIEVLQAQPHVRGVLFDRPGAGDGARAALADAGLGERCEIVGGSFFDKVPAGGDCYLLSAVLPNWGDADALTILRNTRQAMPDHSRLVIFEPLLPTGDGPHLIRAMDMLMLVAFGSQLRTDAQLSALLDNAGLRLTRVAATPSPFSAIEAVPASA
ncbi:MAG: methyltransferase [Egibacteraceae bacterium]